MAGIDASLARLGLDFVDLYQIHGFDPETPIEETIRARSGVGVDSGAGSESTPEWGQSRLRSGVRVDSGVGSESTPERGQSRLRSPTSI
jgi:aldo/keto reductase family protein